MAFFHKKIQRYGKVNVWKMVHKMDNIMLLQTGKVS